MPARSSRGAARWSCPRRRRQSRHRHAGGRGGRRRRGGLLEHVTLTVEPGVIGGMPQGGLDFGAAVNPDAILQQSRSSTSTTAAASTSPASAWPRSTGWQRQCQPLRRRFVGAGGFINIRQNARSVWVRRHVHGRRPRGCGRGAGPCVSSPRVARGNSSRPSSRSPFPASSLPKLVSPCPLRHRALRVPDRRNRTSS